VVIFLEDVMLNFVTVARRQTLKICVTWIAATLICWVLSDRCCHAQESATADSQQADSNTSRRVSVKLEPFKRVRLPSRQEGFIVLENLSPGTIITKGEVIAQLDIERRQLQVKRLQAEIASLEEEVNNKTDLVRAKQEIRASKFRLAELNTAARRIHIPQMELIEAETKLESDNAAFGGAVSRISQAEHTLSAKQAELEILELDINQSKIVAPFDGFIVTQFKNLGEAVSPQEPLAEMFRLDFLRASTFFKQDEISLQNFPNLSGRVEVKMPDGKIESFKIEGPKRLPRLERDKRYLGLVMVKNRRQTINGREDWVLFPGMEAELIIETDAPPASK
jgi:multidrug efflux pump subunit AcrA (membrane-fusion protein)